MIDLGKILNSEVPVFFSTECVITMWTWKIFLAIWSQQLMSYYSIHVKEMWHRDKS
jgi:hypothetical protein